MSALRIRLPRRAAKIGAAKATAPAGRRTATGPIVGESLHRRPDAYAAAAHGKPYPTLENQVLTEQLDALPVEEAPQPCTTAPNGTGLRCTCAHDCVNYRMRARGEAAPIATFTPHRRAAHGRQVPAHEPLSRNLLERVAAGPRELPADEPSQGALLLRDRAELPLMRGAARAAGWAAVMPSTRQPVAETPAAYQSYSLEKWEQQAAAVFGFVTDQARRCLREQAAAFDRAERAIRARRHDSAAVRVLADRDGAA